LLAEVISSKYGIENYLVSDNFDNTVGQEIIKEAITKIKDEIDKQNGKHEAIIHYLDVYSFVPPFVLVKILTLGKLSRLYTILKQVDRQSISKEFKISDILLKQIMKNMTMIRNICAHNDRLFSFHSKFLITFKIIDKNYDNKDKSTNIYMIMKSMKLLLGSDTGKEFESLIVNEIENLKSKIKSVDYNIILY